MLDLNRYVPRIEYYAYWHQKEKFLFYEDKNEDWTIIAVENGSFHYEIDEEKGTASLGDLVICPPGMSFKRVVISSLTFHFIVVKWEDLRGNIVDHGTMKKLFPSRCIYIKKTERLKDNYLFMKHSRSHKSAALDRRLNHLMTDIWYMYCDEKQLQTPVKAINRKQVDEVVNAAKMRIEEQVFDSIHLKELAASFKLSPSQFTKRFKSAFGVNPQEYIISLRMDKAKKLLLETQMNLQQISECCGFHNEYYFNRTFSKHIGISPGKYRKSHQF